MDNAEVIAILQALTQSLKAQAVHLRNLHESYEALFDSLKQDHPQLERTFRLEMEKIRPMPDMQRQIEHIDALLRQLKIS